MHYTIVIWKHEYKQPYPTDMYGVISYLEPILEQPSNDKDLSKRFKQLIKTLLKRYKCRNSAPQDDEWVWQSDLTNLDTSKKALIIDVCEKHSAKAITCLVYEAHLWGLSVCEFNNGFTWFANKTCVPNNLAISPYIRDKEPPYDQYDLVPKNIPTRHQIFALLWPTMEHAGFKCYKGSTKFVHTNDLRSIEIEIYSGYASWPLCGSFEIVIRGYISESKEIYDKSHKIVEKPGYKYSEYSDIYLTQRSWAKVDEDKETYPFLTRFGCDFNIYNDQQIIDAANYLINKFESGLLSYLNDLCTYEGIHEKFNKDMGSATSHATNESHCSQFIRILSAKKMNDPELLTLIKACYTSSKDRNSDSEILFKELMSNINVDISTM